MGVSNDCFINISDAFSKSLNPKFSDTLRKNLSNAFASEFCDQMEKKLNIEATDVDEIEIVVSSIVENILDVTAYGDLSSNWRCHKDTWDCTWVPILEALGVDLQ